MMKRAIPWSDDEGKGSSDSDDESSSSSASDSENGIGKAKTKSKNASKGKSAKRRGRVVDFEDLRRHGYKGAPSLLRMPPPKDDTEPNWTWSTGKEKSDPRAKGKESFEERQQTRAALAAGEQLAHAQTRREKEKNQQQMSFSQKEKRKRDLGQASRGKSYVEEEKRLLRDNGVYSGFDT